MPASTDVTLYTEHAVLPTLPIDPETGVAGTQTNETVTIVKGWMKGSKQIAGLQLNIVDASGGSGTLPPVFNTYHQSAQLNSSNTGFEEAMAKNWNQAYFQIYNTQMLFFDKVTKAIGNGTAADGVLTSGSVYNFNKANFSISSLKAANGYGNLMNVGGDVFTETTRNDHAAYIVTNAYSQAAVEAFNVPIVLIEQKDESAYQKVNHFAIDKFEDGGGLEFMTDDWGTSAGIKLVEGYLTQNRQVYSVNNGTLLTNLGGITYAIDGNKSQYKPTQGNNGLLSEINFSVGAADAAQNVRGWEGGNPAVLYWHIDNSNLSGVVSGKYIMKSTSNKSMNFVDGASAVDGRRSSLSNMVINYAASQTTVDETHEIKFGAKITLSYNVSAGWNVPYKADGTEAVSTTSSDDFVHISNIKRNRTDTAKNQGILFAEGEVTILSDTDKIKVTNQSQSLEDTYALYFNATYTYSSSVLNVITGETSSDVETVNTKPGIPRNIRDKTVTELDPGVYVEWDDHPATGSYSALSYDMKVVSLKITGKTYKSDGTSGALDGSNDTQVEVIQTIPVNYTDVSLQNKYLDINDNKYLPGLVDAITVQITAKNTAGSSLQKTATNISCLEAINTKTTSVDFTLLSCQNPLLESAAEGENVAQPELGTAGVNATHTSATAGVIQSITTDSFANAVGYQGNFITLDVTDYVGFTTGTVVNYIVYANGRLIGSVTNTKLQTDSNKIYVSKIPSSGYTFASIAYETDICFDIIAVSTSSAYSTRTEFSKIIKALGEPAYPPPVAPMGLVVENSPDNGTTYYQNKLDVKFVFLANNRINQFKIFQVNVAGSILVPVESDANTKSEFDSTEINGVVITPATPVDPSVDTNNFRKVYESSKQVWSAGEQTISIEALGNDPLRDNQIIAFVVVVYNVDGVAATPTLPTRTTETDPWVYTTDILFASSQEVTATYALSNINCIAQKQTGAPKKMDINSVSGSSPSYGNFSVSTGAPSNRFLNYSSDTNLKYDVSYKPILNSSSSYYDATTSVDYIVSQSNILWSRTNSSVSHNYNSADLAPAHKFQTSVTAYTNMQQAWADAEDFTGTSTKESIEFTTKSALYVGKVDDSYEDVPANYNKTNKPGLYADQLVIVGDRSVANPLKVKHQEYPLISYDISGETYTAPPSALVNWKWISASAMKATQIQMASTQTVTFNVGDILTVYNVNNGATLDSITLTSAIIADYSILSGVFKCSVTIDNYAAATPGMSIAFTVWRSTTSIFERLIVVSANKKSSGGVDEGEITPSSMTLLPDGYATSGMYHKVLFGIADRFYNVYKDGQFVQTVTKTGAINPSDVEVEILSTSAIYSNYTVTQSFTNSHASDLESNPALKTAPSKTVTTLLRSDIYSIMSEETVKSHVTKAIYDENSTAAETGLFLNNDTTQTQVIGLTNMWVLLSFTVCDTTKTTYEELFDTIFDDNASVTKIQIILENSDVLSKDRNGTWGTSNDIHYDKSIYVNVQGQENTSFTVTGREIRGVKMTLGLGYNAMSYPLVTSASVDAKDVFAIPLNTPSGSDTKLWDILVWVQGSVADSFATALANITGNVEDFSVGALYFNSGEGHLFFTTTNNSFNVGTMSLQGMVGDINGSGVIDDDDVTLYGQFLARNSNGYDVTHEHSISKLSDADRKDLDFNKNTTPTLDIGDAVILLSYVKRATNPSFSNLASPPSTQTYYVPDPYLGNDKSQPS